MTHPNTRCRGLARQFLKSRKTDREQLAYATSIGRCILTHNRVDFERLHIQSITGSEQHFGIIVIPQKSAYEVAQRVGILLSLLTNCEIENRLLYA
ncbi:MAG: hypothetical protein DCF15_16275 [Phormidesmis priestleyi]|uniref:DUF5615 domain-containing protein n=1 Tax=Phormidesmis priestleyi TaxID=268141 RepID=A0A2W4X700_9CYAN|nr:MAG: hypothetical protein DCF15_16275 [Phormidesmis priestleyi]